MGLPEGTEGPHPTQFTALLLQEIRGLDDKPMLDRAHRLYAPRTAKKRAAFATVKKFGLLYPVTLPITLPSGQTHRFEDRLWL